MYSGILEFNACIVHLENIIPSGLVETGGFTQV